MMTIDIGKQNTEPFFTHFKIIQNNNRGVKYGKN